MNTLKEWVAFAVRADVLAGVVYFGFLGALLYLFVRLNRTDSGFKIEQAFLDEQGRASISRVLNAVGGLTATWVIVAQQLSSRLSWEVFTAYLAYMAGVYGLNKFAEARAGVTTP